MYRAIPVSEETDQHTRTEMHTLSLEDMVVSPCLSGLMLFNIFSTDPTCSVRACESAWVEVKSQCTPNPILVCCMYRPPSQTAEQLSFFSDMLVDAIQSSCYDECDFFLTGDFLIPNIMIGALLTPPLQPVPTYRQFFQCLGSNN
eukprot:scpid38167/ scgid7650/ 